MNYFVFCCICRSSYKRLDAFQMCSGGLWPEWLTGWGRSGPPRNNGLREKKTFWLDVIEGFICPICDTKLWGCHPDWMYWKGLDGPWNDSTGSDVAKPTGDVVSIQNGRGVGRLRLGSGLSRCWYSFFFQSPKNTSRVWTPESASYFLYYQFFVSLLMNLKHLFWSDIWGKWISRLG